MQQLSPDDTSSEASGSIIQLDFGKLYEDYKDRIKRYLRNKGHDTEHAADLCQDTFVHFLNYLSRHETDLPQTEYHARNVLYRIARNIDIDEYRKKSINCQPILENDAYAQFDELLIDEKLWLRGELAQMPPKYRKCVVLYYCYGHKEKDIAAMLDMSKSAVSMNVKRGLEYLRRKYYPVTIDLPGAELLKEMMKEMPDQFRNAIAIFDRRFLELQYKGRLNIKGKDVSQLKHRVFECNVYPIDDSGIKRETRPMILSLYARE